MATKLNRISFLLGSYRSFLYPINCLKMLFVKEILIHVLNKICWPFLAAFFVDDLSEPVETKHQEVYQGNNHENEAKQPQNPEPGRFEPIHVRVYRALVGKTVYHVKEECVDKQEGHGLVDV